MSSFKAKILLIEDDKDLSDLLSLKLGLNSYEVKAIYDFVGVEDLLINEGFDLLIVDRNLPSGDSLEKIKALRKEGFTEAVIFLTAKSLQENLLEGFESGGDDYIFKPFEFSELLARIKALLKRTLKSFELLKFKDFILDCENQKLKFEDNEFMLSNLEFRLLKCLFENTNTLLSREFLSENVWQSFTNDKTINIALSRLKQRIPNLKEHIKSIRGVGYELKD